MPCGLFFMSSPCQKKRQKKSGGASRALFHLSVIQRPKINPPPLPSALATPVERLPYSRTGFYSPSAVSRERGTVIGGLRGTEAATAFYRSQPIGKEKGSQPPAKKTTLIDDRYFTSSMAYKLRWGGGVFGASRFGSGLFAVRGGVAGWWVPRSAVRARLRFLASRRLPFPSRLP